jgi:hypothetical protein
MLAMTVVDAGARVLDLARVWEVRGDRKPCKEDISFSKITDLGCSSLNSLWTRGADEIACQRGVPRHKAL